MKTVYKFVKMQSIDYGAAWVVVNKKRGNRIGAIVYDKQWEQWVHAPEPNTIWSADCLTDVQDFIGQLGSVVESGR